MNEKKVITIEEDEAIRRWAVEAAIRHRPHAAIDTVITAARIIANFIKGESK